MKGTAKRGTGTVRRATRIAVCGTEGVVHRTEHAVGSAVHGTERAVKRGVKGVARAVTPPKPRRRT